MHIHCLIHITGERTKAPPFIFFFLCYCFICFFLNQGTSLYAAQTELGLIQQGGYAAGTQDKISLHHNLDKQFIPASILKIVTAYTALKILGPDYRFETRFYLNADNDLIIKGFGDPLLVSEEIDRIALKIRSKNIQNIKDIILDNAAFSLDSSVEESGDSFNPYDAANDALAVNFNTMNLIKDDKGIIHSAEPQTPTLPMMQEFAPAVHAKPERINISQHSKAVLQYSGQLIREIWQQNGIQVSGEIKQGIAPDGLTPLYVHTSSFSLEEVIRRMLLYSNNFIANQLFLAIGMQPDGPPATWDGSRAACMQFLKNEFGFTENEIVLWEGSGLNRKNRVTPLAMLKIVEGFSPYAHLLPEHNGVRVKTGTLTGVYSLAGYIGSKDTLSSFVIILNQPRNTRELVLEKLIEKLPKL